MTHDIWTDRLSEYLDDELTPAERRDLDAHLAGCAACSFTLTDLRRVVERAGTLVAPAPPADLWDGISTRIARIPPQQARQISFTLPQLAAASVLLVLMSGALAWRVHSAIAIAPAAAAPAASATAPRDAPDPMADFPRAEPVGLTDRQYDSAVADLQQALAAGRGKLDPSTVKVVEMNLTTIDRALEQARQALINDPSNSYLTRHLADTRRRKLDLLRRAAAMATDSD